MYMYERTLSDDRCSLYYVIDEFLTNPEMDVSLVYVFNIKLLKLAVLMFKTLHGLAPPCHCLSDECQQVSDVSR